MKAWRIDGLGGVPTPEDVPVPELSPGTVLVRSEVTPLLS
jgi:NADPH:quinone reductase-like Zn-dependent oxidoreductase